MKKPLKNIIFLDIETTSQFPSFEQAPPKVKELFLKKFRNDLEGKELTGEFIEKFYSAKAPISPDFGKIICISFLRIVDIVEMKYKTMSIYGDDEKVLLNSLLTKLPTVSKCENPKTGAVDHICSHSGFLFDWPFISKRMIYNAIPLPAMFDFGELKPWDITWFIDTNQLWKFGTFDGSASLDTLAYNFGLESPKDDMSGDKVKEVYWVEKDLKKIADYCEKDVFALASIYLKIKGIHKQLTK